MKTPYVFPFGEPVTSVEQTDRTRKKVFVLGVYASAVHAAWVDKDEKVVVNAFAVASEPYIFWRGDKAEDIISRIKIPSDLGRLIPAAKNLNGPSGNALDELFLQPLGITRDDAWLCDLVPHSCCNTKQEKAIRREYEPRMKEYNLPSVNLPRLSEIMTDAKMEERRKEILSEIRIADPETIVVLGDVPIKWFINFYGNRWATLSDFGDTPKKYGQLHDATIDGRTYKILPLCHPRQAGKLGAHSEKWNTLHEGWMKSRGA